MKSEFLPIQLLLVRHGTTDWNEKGIYQGRSDIPLNGRGRDEMDRLALPSEFADWKICSSPLVRAQETAERLTGRVPQLVSEAVEMHYGSWEGQSIREVQASLPPAADPFGWRGLDHAAPGGESARQVQERLSPWLRKLQSPTVLITHKGVMLALLAKAWGWPMDRKRPYKVDFSRGQWLQVDGNGALGVVRLNVEFSSK